MGYNRLNPNYDQKKVEEAHEKITEIVKDLQQSGHECLLLFSVIIKRYDNGSRFHTSKIVNCYPEEALATITKMAEPIAEKLERDIKFSESVISQMPPPKKPTDIN